MNTLPSPFDGAGPERGPIARGLSAPVGLDADSDVWALSTTGADALMVGEGAAIAHALNIMWPRLRKPVVHCEGRRLILPVGHEGTLVIRGAEELADRDQQRLLAWRDAGASHARLIATASPLLFTLVKNGGFSRRLFDRLGDVQLVLGP